MPKKIDTCSFLPTAEVLLQWFQIISKSESYLKVFWKGFAYWAGLSKEEYFAILNSNTHEAARAALAQHVMSARSVTVEQFVADMDASDIQAAVLHNSDCSTSLGVPPIPYEHQAEIAKRFPSRFLLLAGIDPLQGKRSVETLRYCLRDLEYAGLLVVPFRSGIPADDDAFKPLYSLCQEEGAPVWIHSTNNWDPKYPTDFSNPRVIDRVAIAYPELKLMAGHAGWPWVLEMVAVAWRHPNVHIEVSAFHPRSLASPGFGFEPLLRFGAGPLQNKLMFGSTWNLLNEPMGEILEHVRDLPGVTPELADKWLHGNAERFFELG